jgi:hypothetical protein
MPAKLHYNVWAFAAQHFVINATYFLVMPTMSTAVLDVKARFIVITAMYFLRRRREAYYEHSSRQLTFFEGRSCTV